MKEARRSRHELLITLPWPDDIAMKKSIALSQLPGGSIESMDASGLRPMKNSGQASEQLAIVSCPRDSFASGGALKHL